MKMTESRPEQLIRAEEFMYDGKVDEALEIFINFEKGRREIYTGFWSSF